VPVNHVGRSVDIAEVAAYLCSEEAGYATRIVLDVDGGISIGSALRQFYFVNADQDWSRESRPVPWVLQGRKAVGDAQLS
jgi:hypothetical protein